MATKVRPGAAKGANKRSAKPLKSTSSSKAKKQSSVKSSAKQHRPKPTTSNATNSKKPPHLRYSDKELKVPQLNGIRPAGVQKAPNKKKGKTFVDDGAGMRTILALVMAEKEGNIESKMIRARQMEEIREAKRAEAEKRLEGKMTGLEERKREIKQERRQRRRPDGGRGNDVDGAEEGGGVEKKPKKRVSFG